MERITIDVIVPVYNGAAFLPAFAAMFARQADPRVRLLMVDDGSTDGSGALMDALAGEGTLPVKVLHRENGGVSAARNAGLAAAEGDYVTFFDVDDLAAPDYVAALLAAAEREPEVFVFRQRRVTDENTVPAPAGEGALCSRTPAEALTAFLEDPTRLGVYNILLSRTFVEKTGLRFAEGYRYYEDYDFLYRAFAGAAELLCSDRELYYYVLRDGSAMGRFDGARLSCLGLMRQLEGRFRDSVPAFAPLYDRWGTARIYWSVLWQAALAAPSFRDFRRFARKTYARVYMKMVRDFPRKKVALSARLFRASPRAYYAAVRLLGERRTNVRALSPRDYEAAGEGCPDPRRVLVYGMTDNPGGIESYVMGVFRRLPPGTFDFLCDFPTIDSAGEIAARGARVHFIPAKSKGLWAHWKQTARVLRDHPEYDTVYFNVLDAGCVFTGAVAWLLGRRIVVHSHNDDTDKRRLHRLCRPFLNLITDGRAACSQGAARYMFGDRPWLYVPNRIDGARYAFDLAARGAIRRELGLEGRLVLCHVGRLSRQKNPLFLADVLEAVRAERPEAVLLSVGEGEISGAFDEYVRQKRLEAAVLRLGRRDDVPALLQGADVFLFPSLYEGLGIALLEAQAAGLPCVVSERVPDKAVVTDLVRRVELTRPAEEWARAVLAAAGTPRKNTLEAIRAAGFDLAGGGGSDRALLALLRDKE